MNNKEKLLNLFEGLSESKIRKSIYPYLLKVYDSMVVKPKTDEIVSGDLDGITDEDVIGILKIFGEQPQIEDNKVEPKVIEDNKLEDKKEIKTEEDSVPKELYDTTLEENEKLRINLKKQSQVIDSLTNKIDKLERIFERLQKYNITETSELIVAEDDDINKLYINYITEGQIELNNAIIVEKDDSVIMPKSYYKMDKGR